MITSRRSLFGFGAALIAAPAIVRVASIMPVSVPGYSRYYVGEWTATVSSGDALTLAQIRRIVEWVNKAYGEIAQLGYSA